MNQSQPEKRDFETIAWGAIFIWWGVTELVPALPAGSGALGFGLILLGLNAARSRSGIPTSSFSIGLGIIALVWGGLELAGPLLHLPFELPTFAIVLIAFGIYILARNWAWKRPA
jgi:hypothetical protein